MAYSAKKDLVKRYLADGCTPTERDWVVQFLATPEGEALLWEVIAEQNWEATLPAASDKEGAALNRVWEQLASSVEEESVGVNRLPVRRYWLYGAVASVSILILFFVLQPRFRPKRAVEMAFREIVVPAGGRSAVTLSDGSRIWLNAQSRLRYPRTFAGAIRSVELEGEAYFEVSHDPAHPFVIQSRGIRTQVLGTSFNVRAYADEPELEVAVLTGKVRVTDNRQESLTLLPNQKGVYNPAKGGLRQKTIGNAADYRAWTQDRLVFEATTVAEIVRLLNRRFAVNIVVKNKAINHCVLTTRFDRPTLDGVLSVVCKYLGARYRRDGATILLEGNGC